LNSLAIAYIYCALIYRLNINNGDYKLFKEKRDRAVKYWKDRVIQDFLPPIDSRKRNEINERVKVLKTDVKQELLIKQQQTIKQSMDRYNT